MKPRRSLSESEANAVWDVLVELAGASEKDREAFVFYLTDPAESWWHHEYRFMGLLGFGGKLHFDDYNGARVSCYPEHRDEVRVAIITAANERIAALVPSRRVAGSA